MNFILTDQVATEDGIGIATEFQRYAREGDADHVKVLFPDHREAVYPLSRVEKFEGCEHQCTSNCRREGCNCACGEFHEDLSEIVNESNRQIYEDKVAE